MWFLFFNLEVKILRIGNLLFGRCGGRDVIFLGDSRVGNFLFFVLSSGVDVICIIEVYLCLSIIFSCLVLEFGF